MRREEKIFRILMAANASLDVFQNTGDPGDVKRAKDRIEFLCDWFQKEEDIREMRAQCKRADEAIREEIERGEA